MTKAINRILTHSNHRQSTQWDEFGDINKSLVMKIEKKV